MLSTLTHWELYKWYIIGALSLIIGQAALISWLLVLRTARRRAESALSESENRYRGVVETQSELICRYLPDTTLTFVNDAYCRFWRKTRDELIGRRFIELIPEAARAAALNHVASLIARPRVEMDEHEVLLPDGDIGWQQWIDHVVHDAQGRVVELQAIGRDVTEQKRAEASLRRSEAALRASHARTQDLAGRLIAAQDSERARIARDLHDEVSQRLAAMAIGLSSLKRAVSPSLLDSVAVLQQQASRLAGDVRLLSRDLHPELLRHIGLVSALKAHCAQFALQHQIAIDVVATSDIGTIEPDTALCLYRVAQEALHNVVRHAHARHARVILTAAAGVLELAVVDDGRGFDLARAHATNGLGLVSIDERVRLISGRMTISSEPGLGTTLRVELPS